MSGTCTHVSASCGRRLIGPQGVGSRNLADPVPGNRGTRPYKVPQTERTRFAAIRFHGRQNALASWVAAILRIWGTLLVPCGSTVARNSILAEVGKSCKREKIKILQSGKSPNRRLSVTGSPPQYHRPPACALPPPRPKYGTKYVIAKRAGPFSLEKQGKDGPVVELRGTHQTVQKRINRRGGGISRRK